MKAEAIAAFVSAITAIVSAAIAMTAAIYTKVAIKHAAEQGLFTTFDVASQMTVENPELLYAVHGLDSGYSSDEARAIAYLSTLLDSFQHFYGKMYNNDFGRMANEFKIKSTFLNRILAHPPNQSRWGQIKRIYYGEFDAQFVEAVEELIRHEASHAVSREGGKSKPPIGD